MAVGNISSKGRGLGYVWLYQVRSARQFDFITVSANPEVSFSVNVRRAFGTPPCNGISESKLIAMQEQEEKCLGI